MRVGIVSSFWGREQVSRIWAKGAQRIIRGFNQYHIDCEVFAAVSDSQHKSMLEKAGFHTVWRDNADVAGKWNAAAQQALGSGVCDYLLILGSDDFLSDGLIGHYISLIEARIEYAGLREIYMVEPATGRCMLLDGTRKALPTKQDGSGMADARIPMLARRKRKEAGLPLRELPQSQPPVPVTLGAGRLIRSSLFHNYTDRTGDRDYWEPGRSRALDSSLSNRLALPPAHIIETTNLVFAVDVKTEANIWSYDALLEWYPTCEIDGPGPVATLPEWPDIAAL